MCVFFFCKKRLVSAMAMWREFSGGVFRSGRGRRRDERLRPAGGAKCGDVAADEVDGLGVGKLVPGERRVLAPRAETRAEDRDRPLARIVEVGEAAPLRLVERRGVEADPELREPGARARAEIVARERSEEHRLTCERCELGRGDGAAARRLLERLARV